MVYNEKSMTFRAIVLVPLFTIFAGCATQFTPLPKAWSSPPETARPTHEQLRFAARGGGAPGTAGEDTGAPRANENIRIVTDAEGSKLYRGDTALTPAFAAIDSFDVNLERREVILSAKRDSNFDVGLVAIDGSAVHWIPEDPADEVAPRWAPRGHKASYIVRNRGGDLVRTVHIPTSFQLLVEFPFGLVRDLAWDDAGERIAVAWESADASPRIEVMRYGGEERRVMVPPAVDLDVTVTPFAGGLLMRPSSVVYNETLPLVVWTDRNVNSWSDARGSLMRERRLAMLVIDKPMDEAVAASIRESSWIDPGRVYVVGSGASASVRADDAVPAGFYERHANGIAVNPRDIESAAVGFLKGNESIGQRRE